MSSTQATDSGGSQTTAAQMMRLFFLALLCSGATAVQPAPAPEPPTPEGDEPAPEPPTPEGDEPAPEPPAPEPPIPAPVSVQDVYILQLIAEQCNLRIQTIQAECDAAKEMNRKLLEYLETANDANGWREDMLDMLVSVCEYCDVQFSPDNPWRPYTDDICDRFACQTCYDRRAAMTAQQREDMDQMQYELRRAGGLRRAEQRAARHIQSAWRAYMTR
eukprot:SAG22_NODE_524_length_9488_cov_16.150602_7_plen_218_part_00